MPDDFDVSAMLQAAGEGRLAAAPPSFPMVEARPSGPAGPSGVAPMTNLSPEDYAKFMAGRSPSPTMAKPAIPPPVVSGDQPIDVGKMLEMAGAGKLPVTEKPVAEEQPKQSVADQVIGPWAALANAVPRGITGNAIDYLNAATQAPLRMMVQQPQPQGPKNFGFQGPLTAFQEGLANEQAGSQALEKRYPITSTGGQLMGGAATGAMMPLGYAAPAAAGLIPKIGAVANYLGRNAATGGVMSALSGGDPLAGAAIGGGAAGLLPGVAKVVSAPVSAVSSLAPLWSNAARTKSVQQTLQRDLAGSPIAPSPLGPNAPLDLAQATGNPQIAAKTRYAQGIAQQSARDLQEAQTKALQDQIGQLGAPSTLADASSQGVGAIRDLRQVARQRETELWNVPGLADYRFQTNQVKDAAQQGLNTLQRTEPGLMLAMTGKIRGALNGLANTPERVNLKNINSYVSALKAVARQPPLDNPQAGVLASRLLEHIEPSIDATVSSSGAPSGILQAYQTARDFTRQRATIFNTQDMKKVLDKKAGLYTADASEAMKKFFNFSNGSPEGPRNVKELMDFADQIKGAVLGRGSQLAQSIGMTRNQLRDAGRSYVAAALTDASRLNQEENFNPKLMQAFLRKNNDWMQTSGWFQKPQIEAADKLLDYVTRLRHTEQLTTFTGSATNPKGETAKTFIDEIMSPRLRHVLEIVTTLGGLHAHGGMGAVAGGVGSQMAEKGFLGAEKAMREMMAAAMLDSRMAKDLMMKPTNTGFLSPQTRDLLNRVRLSIGSDVLPQALAPSPQAVQVGQ